jgi:hypothetical protein
MELSRRDVLAALAATGVAAGAGATLYRDPGDGPVSDHDIETLVAVAQTVYPSEVENVREFVEQYSATRVRDRPEYAEGVADAVAALDEYTRDWEDAQFVELDRETARETLSGFSVDTADPDPEGSDRERVRFYLANEVLYALFTTPTGGELAGIENPQGHPGGTASYQRGPR